uniref:Uncharacterized protein n=1 Tax=Caenorhabditis japonica TaxID=281687 RepID=A0A8R1EN72_CAEJA
MHIGSGFLAVKTRSAIKPSSFAFIPFQNQWYFKPKIKVTLPTNSIITNFTDLVTRIITSRAYPLDCSLVTNFEYIINETLFSLNPKTLEIRKNLNFHPQEVSSAAYFTTTPLEDNPVIFHDMIIGSLSENIPETHYNEIWESMQCSITRQFSARTDPTSGPISSAGIEQAFDF